MADILFGDDLNKKGESSTSKNDSKSKIQRAAHPGMVVELVQGEQWADDLSGISLIRGHYRLIGKDEYDGISDEDREKAYVAFEEKATATLEEGMDLSRVEKALRLKILKEYDPENPTVYHNMDRDPRRLQHGGANDTSANGYKFVDSNDEKIVEILKLDLAKFINVVSKIKTLSSLETLFNEEHQGRNPVAAPRRNYVLALKQRMRAPDVSGPGQIRVTNEETVFVNSKK